MSENSVHKILVIDDEAVIREGLRQALTLEGYQVIVAPNGKVGMEKLQKDSFSVVISDLKMPIMGGIEVLKTIAVLQPNVPVIIITGFATVDSAVDAMKNGAFEYLTKPFLPDQIVEKVQAAIKQRLLNLESEIISESIPDESVADSFIGKSEAMQKVFQRILQVAPTASSVLITGESGTGKELVARAIHNNSPRKEEPFVAIDCNSLPENLLESELFGHVKGSFTGATQSKPGLFSVASGGSLFLDEIANLSMATQAKLLRVLQQREVAPIGGTKATPIDIRLIAATNRGLDKMVEEGTFRDDLYFRLNIIPISLPPLRERAGDIPLLIGYFLKKFSEEVGREIKGLSADAHLALHDYPFPGNVRELENIIERAVVLSQGNLIHRESLELPTSQEIESALHDIPAPINTDELKEVKRIAREQAVEPVEKAFVYAALERNGWNVTKAAEETGMLRPNFQALLKKLGISVKDHI
ncbi:two component, sigma54 specific, transcriptional regulator, Fis family [Desulfuromusa kysingii]|uniref:Two component, sigma54 specific, transcriptional regulator, Fis family n=1 Tax=Desulfuromusa kysingii TaxID=37625 RepID=A0A1H3VM05_9BACT|nr:sigma-54 dependent transcriptional regulator [Desulfuromusa kysingii]SDZ75158.1 two component, sigma54 specific, transcriptional regulator, Fis family [Desulfuromusa kysingii]